MSGGRRRSARSRGGPRTTGRPTARSRRGKAWPRRLRALAWGVGGAAVGALALLNLSVAFFGESVVFPLSPFFLPEKVHALGVYAHHRPGCLLAGHPPLGPLVLRAERRHRLPPGLLAALVEVESEGRAHRISAAGAMGPGQLMPTTAAELGVEDPFEPEAALDASARYLARHLARFRRVDLAVAAYNAGPGAVVGRVPHNGQTEHYVVKVLTAWRARRPVRTAGHTGG